MKVIVAGCRDFNNQNFIDARLHRFIGFGDLIVSGGASGVDSYVKVHAASRGLEFVEFKADWEKHGRSAGPIRNKQMAEYSDALLAFWDGKSKGTLNMITEAVKATIPVHIISIVGVR